MSNGNTEGAIVPRDNTLHFLHVLEDERRFAALVLSIETDEQAEKFMNDFIEARKIVRALDRLAHLRHKATVLENKMYVALYEKGFRKQICKVGGAQVLKACEWISTLSDAEKQQIVNNGNRTIVTSHTLHRKEQLAKEYADRFAEESVYVRRKVIETFKETGIVDISKESISRRFTEKARRVPSSTVNDFIDGTKDRLLETGAYGIGEGKYARLDDEDAVQKAIDIRVKSLSADLVSIARIFEKAMQDGIAVTPLELKGINNVNRNLNDTSLVYLTMLLNPILRGRLKWTFETEKVAKYLRFSIDRILNDAYPCMFDALQSQEARVVK